jgi:putative endonuclease
MPKQSYVYILTDSQNHVLYTGVTSDLAKRLYQHRGGQGSSFARKYRAWKLAYYEVHEDILQAIAREKQIKSWSRSKKVGLIEGMNPEWRDLAKESGLF